MQKGVHEKISRIEAIFEKKFKDFSLKNSFNPQELLVCTPFAVGKTVSIILSRVSKSTLLNNL